MSVIVKKMVIRKPSGGRDEAVLPGIPVGETVEAVDSAQLGEMRPITSNAVAVLCGNIESALAGI